MRPEKILQAVDLLDKNTIRAVTRLYLNIEITESCWIEKITGVKMADYNLDYSREEYLSALAELEADIVPDLEAQDHVAHRFRYTCFVSKSKGRGRKRKHWTEVELIYDTWERGVWRSWNKFPWDTKATETFPEWDHIEAERELQRRIVHVRSR